MLWWNMLFKYTVLNYRFTHTVAKLSDPKFNLCEVSKPDLGTNAINRTTQQLLHNSVLLNQAMLSWNSSACRAAIALPHRSLFHQATCESRALTWTIMNWRRNIRASFYRSSVASERLIDGPPVSVATLLSNRSFDPSNRLLLSSFE